MIKLNQSLYHRFLSTSFRQTAQKLYSAPFISCIAQPRVSILHNLDRKASSILRQSNRGIFSEIELPVLLELENQKLDDSISFYRSPSKKQRMKYKKRTINKHDQKKIDRKNVAIEVP